MPRSMLALAALSLGCSGDDVTKESADAETAADTATNGPDTGSTRPTDTATETGTPPDPRLAGDWVWVNPLPQGTTVVEMQFTSPDRAFALTEGSGILRTTDRGATWESRYGIQDLGYRQLNAAWFIDDARGWVVGAGGTIAFTTDAGASWVDQTPADLPFDLFDVQFTSPTRGVVVGATGRILSTDDGGATWTDRRPPGLTTFLHGVAFVDDTTGWAVGDDATVLSTINGGVSWEPLITPFVNDLRLATPAGSGLVASGRSRVRLFDGMSWSILHDVDNVYAVQFTDLDEGTMLAERSIWLELTTFTPGNPPDIEELDLRPSPTAFARDGDRLLLGGFRGAMYASDDGGTSFDEAWTQQALPEDAQFFDVSMAGSRGVAAGSGGLVAWTDDGGVTWTQAVSGTGTDLRSVWLDASGRGVAAGYAPTPDGFVTVIVFSNDHGQTWATSTIPADEAFIEGVALWTDGRGIAVGGAPGGNEALWLSDDAGQTWTAVVRDETTPGFVDVWTVGSEHAWLGAGFGVVVRTTNGGTSFDTIDSETNRAFESVNFVDATNGWAATGSQDVLRTIDGGSSWEVVPVPGTSLRGIAFGDTSTGIAVGSNGTVYGSGDGGATWTRQPAGWSSRDSVRAVAMPSPRDAVIVGTEVKISISGTAGGLVPR